MGNACKQVHDPTAPCASPSAAGVAVGEASASAIVRVQGDGLRGRGAVDKGLAEVALNIYSVGTAAALFAFNAACKPLGLGAFHCGVEVFGEEWSFSDVYENDCGTEPPSDGVFSSVPMSCAGHTFLERVPMGRTLLRRAELRSLVALLIREWPASSYDVLTRNCCHFSEDFCRRLGVGPIPEWVKSLAGAGAALEAAGDGQCCRSLAGGLAETTPLAFCTITSLASPGRTPAEVVTVEAPAWRRGPPPKGWASRQTGRRPVTEELGFEVVRAGRGHCRT